MKSKNQDQAVHACSLMWHVFIFSSVGFANRHFYVNLGFTKANNESFEQNTWAQLFKASLA